jgi:hypothetical protein
MRCSRAGRVALDKNIGGESGDALGDLQWEGSIRRYNELAQACADKHGHRKWWLDWKEPQGPSKHWGVYFQSPSWRAYPPIGGVKLHLGTCKCEDDAGLVVDFALVALGLAPKNFPEFWDSIKARVEAGESGAVPAVARVELLGDVHRKQHVARVDRASVAAVDDKIHETVTKDEVKRNWYHTDLSDMSDVPGAEWMAALADESDDVETVGDLAMVDVFDKDIMLALTGSSHSSARRRLWGFKRDAADFLGVEIPEEVPDKPRQERPAKHQRVPDGVANHFIPWLIG